MTDFTHFVGIDWTGAKGKRHAGLAVALCEAGDGAPKLIKPPSGNRHWSRLELSDWLTGGIGRRAGERLLVGIDSSFGMPFDDEDAYLPGSNLPDAIHDLWQHVADLCGAEADLYGGPFVEAHAPHYLRSHGKQTLKGELYRRRMRRAETLAVESGAGPCESVFHLVGPSQVGLSGLSTMAVLHRAAQADHVAIWPFDDPSSAPLVLVEIYAAAFAAMGGHKGKIRDREALAPILKALGCVRQPRLGLDFTDHAADACVTAAALRKIAGEPKYWKPAALSAKVRRTEGWIFGIV